MLLSLPLVGEEEAMEHHLLMEGEEGEGSFHPQQWVEQGQLVEAKVEVQMDLLRVQRALVGEEGVESRPLAMGGEGRYCVARSEIPLFGRGGGCVAWC